MVLPARHRYSGFFSFLEKNFVRLSVHLCLKLNFPWLVAEYFYLSSVSQRGWLCALYIICTSYCILMGVWWGTRWAASLSNWRVFIFPVRKFGIIDLVCKKYINLLVAPSNPLKSQWLITIKVQLGVLQRTLWSSKLTVSHLLIIVEWLQWSNMLEVICSTCLIIEVTAEEQERERFLRVD